MNAYPCSACGYSYDHEVHTASGVQTVQTCPRCCWKDEFTTVQNTSAPAAAPAASETPRSDHYRSEFKRRKQTPDGLTEYLLDEFAQEERRLNAALMKVDEFEKAVRFAGLELAKAKQRAERAEALLKQREGLAAAPKEGK